MNIEVFLQIFLWFKFCTSVQICIYLPTFVLIYTLCNRCCPTERYIRTVRIPGDLWFIVVNNVVLGYPPDSDFLEHSKYVQYLVKQNESSAFSSLSHFLYVSCEFNIPYFLNLSADINEERSCRPPQDLTVTYPKLSCARIFFILAGFPLWNSSVHTIIPYFGLFTRRILLPLLRAKL